MVRINWIEDGEATGELAKIYQGWKKDHPDRDQMPGILKCLSMSPDFLKHLIKFIYPLHFSDGHLPYSTKEMIATFVSGLNRCPY